MKVAIVFYSFSGNTKSACMYLKENLSADLIELKPIPEETSFIKQCKLAFFKVKPELKSVNYDLSGYDFVIFATAVWAFTYTPALRTYFDNVRGLEGKKGACFLTYGSGLGSVKALKELENVLKEKGVRLLFSKNLSGVDAKSTSYLEKNLKALIDIVRA